MMNAYRYPEQAAWAALCQRPDQVSELLDDVVAKIFKDIATDGDAAVIRYNKAFDKQEVAVITQVSLADAERNVPYALQQAIQVAARNITTFHAAQAQPAQRIDTMPGVTCWREDRAIQRVGIYIPGGTAPLFSTVLMLAIPARLAGCSEVVLCTPPAKDGSIDPAILYAAALTGVTRVFAIGGAQAIAAMAIGTDAIPRVDKLFGPGNQYVMAAKVYAQRMGVAIDLPAGPSEVLVIADKDADPVLIAADLLSQAEHGEDSQVILLSDDEDMIARTLTALDAQLLQLPRKDIAAQALANSRAVLLTNIDACMAFSNAYAPEHLVLATDAYEALIPKITNAGSVFLGKYSCESAGDYASGTNHTLPTSGYARNYSGVSLDSFVKKMTFQHITAQGLKEIGPVIVTLADAEGLTAHKQAVSLRLQQLDNSDTR